MKRAWQIPKIWDGGEVWILGGGPSLIDCFNIPEDLVKEVRTRKKGIEAYSPYLAKIHTKHIIGINVAYQFGSWVDICFFGDYSPFFLEHMGGLVKYRGMVVSCDTKVAKKDIAWVKYLEREEKRGVPHNHRRLGISDNSNAVRWNHNSGAAAISLAAHLGAKRIILVGFDMTVNTTLNRHFHNEYRSPQGDRTFNPKSSPFNLHLRGFPFIKKDADRLGIEIINTSLNSAIEDFPKVDINELL